MSHDERKDDCNCPMCKLRKEIEALPDDRPDLIFLKLIETIMQTRQPRALGPFEKRWIKYQKSMSRLRGYIARLGDQRASAAIQNVDLGEKYEASTLGPLTGYQLVVRECDSGPAVVRAREEMGMIAHLFTPLLVGLLEDSKPLVSKINDPEQRKKFFDHAATFDAIVILRTVLLDMAGTEYGEKFFDDIDTLGGMGELMTEAHKLLKDDD